MVLKLKQLFDIVGDRQEFQSEVSLDELKSIIGYTFKTPVIISGALENRAEVVRIKFCTQFCMMHCCDRCLKEFEREYSFDFQHLLVRRLAGDSDDYIVCENDELDLNELAVSDLLLQLSSKILCDNNCKGLCFKCGADLNASDCSCKE